MTLAQHQMQTVEAYTPKEYVEAARVVLRGITLDPASCWEAQETVQAGTWFGPESPVLDCQDGLRCRWGQDPGEMDFMYASRVFLNPPGGKLRRCGDLWVPVTAGPGKSSAAVWWGKLVEEYGAGRVGAFVFIGFTLEVLRSSQDLNVSERWAGSDEFSLCFPSGRMRFRGNSPSHANVIVYGGPDHDEFRRVFSAFGACR